MKVTPATFAASAVALTAFGLLAWQHQTHQDELRDLEARLRKQENASRPANRQKTSRDSVSVNDSSAEQAPKSAQPGKLADILARRDPSDRVRALLAFAENVPTAGITAALKQLREGSPEWDPEAKLAIHVLLTRWGREDPSSALDHLRAINPGKQGGDAISLLSGVASLDPQRAAAWIADPENPLPAYPFMGLFLAGSVGKEWVRQDPAAAMTWARGLPDSQRTGAYVGLLATLAGSDPATAATLGTELEPGNARKEALSNIAKTWGKQSPQDALAWAQTLKGNERSAALGEALSSWADTQPAAAARYLGQLEPDAVSKEHLKAVVEPWANQAPADATQWLASRPDGEAKTEAMEKAVWRWTMTDPMAASTWLQSQPPGAARDSAVGGLARATFETDPAASLTWASSMTDEKKRKMSVAIGLKEWAKRDAPAATAWAAQNGVTLP